VASCPKSIGLDHPPVLEEKKGGKGGRRKITQWTRYLTFCLRGKEGGERDGKAGGTTPASVLLLLEREGKKRWMGKYNLTFL